jgi:hypothetical protein
MLRIEMDTDPTNGEFVLRNTSKDVYLECPWCAEYIVLPFYFGMTNSEGGKDYHFLNHLCLREPVSEVVFRVERKIIQ